MGYNSRKKSEEDEQSSEVTEVTYDLKPVTAWRQRVKDFTPLIGPDGQANLDALRDVVYGMALHGASEKDIAEFFGFDAAPVREQLGPIITMAKAELRLALKKDQILTALGTKQPIAKIWAGKNFSEQSDNGPVGDGGSFTASDIQFNVSVIGKSSTSSD